MYPESFLIPTLRNYNIFPTIPNFHERITTLTICISTPFNMTKNKKKKTRFWNGHKTGT